MSRAALGILVAAGVFVAAAVLIQRSQPGMGAGTGRGAGAKERVLAVLPEFVLEDQEGDDWSPLDLRGEVWVADFIFTRCAGTCPVITRTMSALQGKTTAPLVSIDVDPDFDTPERLREYAKAAGADPARWTFLTGPKEVVRSVAREGFKLPVADGGEAAMPIVHAQSLALIDRAGRVRGLVDGTAAGAVDEAVAAIEALRHEPRPLDIYAPADLAHPAWLEPRRAAQLASAASLAAPHDFAFHDRLGASGIAWKHGASVDVGKYYRAIHYDHGTAVAVADVDGDGLPDLYFANQVGRNALYRNLGGGRFEDITDRAGVGVGDRACAGAAFADIDDDGAPDL
ncbi:MAG TPA: SCO family protein, partial [Planctomycetota bacterium]|nr:SCO family protein [Planctomycetota bacterium]